MEKESFEDLICILNKCPSSELSFVASVMRLSKMKSAYCTGLIVNIVAYARSVALADSNQSSDADYHTLPSFSPEPHRQE